MTRVSLHQPGCIRAVATCVLIMMMAATHTLADSSSCTWSSKRLPTTVRPTHYDLELTTDVLKAPYTVTGRQGRPWPSSTPQPLL